MKNKNIIIIVIVALIILITLGIIFISQKATNKTGSTNLNPIEKQEDLSTLIAQDFVIARTIFIANASVILYNKFTLLILE